MFCLHKMPLFVRHSPLKQKRLKCKLNMKFSCCFCVSLALKVLSSICLKCFKPENKASQGIQFLAMSLLFYACPNQHYYFYHKDSDVGRQDTM